AHGAAHVAARLRGFSDRQAVAHHAEQPRPRIDYVAPVHSLIAEPDPEAGEAGVYGVEPRQDVEVMAGPQGQPAAGCKPAVLLHQMLEPRIRDIVGVPGLALLF